MSSKKYFENVAEKWDEMRQSFFSVNVRETAIEVANVEKNKIAADIGAGTGFITEGLIERGVKIIAVDQSEAMINKMKDKFREKDSIDYRIGESENLPIENDSVDYVFSNMYLHHTESPLKAIREMARILKKEGTLVITDADEHNFEFLRTEQHDRWLGFKRDDIEKWFKSAGLKNIRIDCSGENCCTESGCGCENARISIFVASGQK